MVKNYFKIALRNLAGNKVYSIINISGLAAGIAGCILISVFIIDELNYDKHNKNYKNIYRVVTDLFVGGQENNLSVTSFPAATALKKDYPEVREAARIVKWSDPFIKTGGKVLREKALFFADNSVLKIFSFGFIYGDAKNSLSEPNSIIITAETAEKYFGTKNALGKTILYENALLLKVTGIIKKFPSNSHLIFDMLISFPTLEAMLGKDYLESWHSFFKIYTYILLPEGYLPGNLEKKFPGFVKSYMADEVAESLGRSYKLSLQPLSGIHLYSQRISEAGDNGSIESIYIFSTVAFFILFLACINFTNLSTARSIRRAKEVCLRKVLGAERKQLILQFMGEAFISIFIAVPAAVISAEFLLPYFNSISGKDLSINILNKTEFILTGSAFLIFIGLAAGSYPAFFLSKSRYNSSLKAGYNIVSERKASLVRKILIVFQFTVSVALIVCTLIVKEQLSFAREKKIGMEKESVIVLSFSDGSVRKGYGLFRESVLKNPLLINSSYSSFLPAKGIIRTPVKKQAADENEKFEMTTLPIDNNFLETFGIKLVQGRFFSEEFPSDTVDSYLINESAAKALGWHDPADAVGQKLDWLGTGAPITGNIIGVVKDFHVQSLRSKIEPLFIIPQNMWPLNAGFISVKCSNKDLSKLIPYLEDEWKKYFPSVPYEYSFLDEDFGKFYLSEEKLGKLFGSFALLAVFIAVLGLYGLAAFAAEVKTKEVGIRKVLGASSGKIIFLLSREFLFLILIANLTAVPIAFYSMSRWLQDFAYRTEIHVSSFLFAGAAALLISLLTVLYHSFKAANANPAKTLRCE